MKSHIGQKDTEPRLSRSELHGWLIALFGLGGFLLWAATYPIQQGVYGSGFLISQTDKMPVVAHMTGLVSSMPKKLGDNVQKGDVLLEFDAGQLQAAERGLLQSRQGQIRIAGSLKQALQSKQEQLEALRVQYSASSKLVDAGFASATSLAAVKSQLSLAESEMLEMQARINQYESSVREIDERLASVKYELGLLRVISPVDGQIMNTGVKSPGMNVIVGSQIMEIAPQTREFWVDARIPVEMGDRISAGMPVNIMFPTLQGNQTPRVNGLLQYLSADRITDTRTGQVYLEARVSFMPDELKSIGSVRVGMPVSVIINTGPRTLLSYMLRPLNERLNRGLY